jgi:ABC-2 type transport system ATP-binding protein
VALAGATIHEPPLLFLDEPTAGVDPVSRRDFWEQIHQIASGGTTVLLTTHYMDEAERCHRLAFIFRGTLLVTGTPEDIVRQRDLRVVELETPQATRAATLLRAQPEVEEVAHYGATLRVAARRADAEALARQTLAAHQIPIAAARPARATVEDAFVSMVREDERHQGKEAA